MRKEIAKKGMGLEQTALLILGLFAVLFLMYFIATKIGGGGGGIMKMFG